jgi:hypothetical protein
MHRKSKPRLQPLEKPRLLPGSLPKPDPRPESVRRQTEIGAEIETHHGNTETIEKAKTDNPKDFLRVTVPPWWI